MSVQVNQNGKLALSQVEVNYLESLVAAGDRTGFYMAYYNMTGSEQAVLQAQVSSFSEANGGTAYAANYLLQSHFGPQGEYLGLYRISQLVAESALAAIKADIANGGDGSISDTEMLASAAAAWNGIGQSSQFPGNLFEWPLRAFQIGVPQPDEASLWENIVDICDSISDPELLKQELLTSGTLVALLATAIGPKLFGKRRSDYEDNPAYALHETPDGEWAVAIRISDGKTVAVFDDDLVPDSITDFAGALAALASEVITDALTPHLSIIEHALRDLRTSLTEGTAGFDGEVYDHVDNPPFIPTTFHHRDEPTSGDDVLWGTDGLGGVVLADDEIDGGAGKDVIFGGDGDDELRGGDNDDILYGDEDDDTLYGDGGNDVLRGGDGEDQLFGNNNDDVLEGGEGEDQLFGEDGNDVLEGGDDRDYLNGGTGADRLYGGGGFDLLVGGDGNDVLTPGQGAVFEQTFGENQVLTGLGSDTVYARNGSQDWIQNEGGADEFYIDARDSISSVGTLGRVHYRGTVIDVSLVAGVSLSLEPVYTGYTDPIWGTPHYVTNNRIKFYETEDGALEFWLYLQSDGQLTFFVGRNEGLPVGTTSWDTLADAPWPHIINTQSPPNAVVATGEQVPLQPGEASQDQAGVVSGSDGDDSLSGDGAYLVIEGLGGDDTITGGSGSDILTGGAGADHLLGASGDDILSGNSGSDLIQGGDGWDLLRGGDDSDVLYGDEGSDALLGGQGDDQLFGGLQADDLQGDAGDDELTGGAADDSLAGGTGSDTYFFNRGDGQDVVRESVDLSGELDVIRMGVGISPDDILVSVNGDSRTFSLAGTNDSITVHGWYASESQRIERMEFEDGTVWDSEDLNVARFIGSEGSDSLDGTAGPDAIDGRAGDDLLVGYEGDDAIEGGTGDDTIQGGEGDDTLHGGAGADLLYGGYAGGAVAGSDVFVFAAGDGHDVVSDEDASGALDTIRFTGQLAPEDVSVFQRNNNLVFELIATSESVTVLNGQWNNDYRIERIEFGSGVIWDTTQMTFAIVGDAADNVEMGTSGDDMAMTFGGSDTIDSGAGHDYLDGGAGDDVLIGGQGNDIYIVDSEFDALTELASQGTDEVRSTLTWTLATNFENLTLLGTNNTDGTGNSATNVITGNAGENLLDGKGGADTLIGGAGNDTYIVDNAGDVVVENSDQGIDLVRSSITVTLADNIENLTLTGSAAVNATGNALDNVITGNTGNNVMSGGLGNDTYVVAQAGDVVVESAGEGVDQILSSVTYALQGNVENLTLTGSSAIGGTGNELDNVIVGNTGANALNGAAGNDTLDGGAGADTLAGGQGDDTYIVDNASDVVTEAAAEGTDTVRSSVTHTLASNVENLTLTGAAAINGVGNAAANALTGNVAANTLNGGGGADTLSGGAGNDTYVVDDALDSIVESAGEGIDTVQAAVTYSLAVDVENLTLTGAAAIDGTGNELDNVLTGNSGLNTLAGGAGNDTYIVGAGDTVVETAGNGTDLVQASVTYELSTHVENLTLTGASAINGTGNELDNALVGNAAVNTLTGGLGNDTLNGAAGADALIGGAGDDLYVVDDAGDAITENALEGLDSVESSVTYTLASNVENLTLTGTAAINATGNALDNVLTGNAGANTLTGGAGADTMLGGLGNDTYGVDNVGDLVVEGTNAGTDTVQSSISYALGANVENLTLTGSSAINGTGNDLNNVLRGNTGINTLVGGLGNDTYVVNNTGDVVSENAGEGTDTVQSSVTYTLSANTENLTLTGSSALNGTGNELDNQLVGNAGTNQLSGGQGNDTLDGEVGADALLGGAGDDTYIVDNAGDAITEGVSEGTDTVQSSVTHTLASNVENLVLAGASAINGTGNGLDNSIIGNDAANTLNGGAGVDVLAGGLGNDIYVVDNAGDSVVEAASAGTDTVQASVTYGLAANVENLTLTGSSAIDATGNALDNVLTGNSASNVLAGGTGNDTYVVGAGDTVIENAAEGTDTVQAAIAYTLGANLENLTLTGSGAISGTGNDLDNVLTGNTGANTLSGGADNDTLNGGAGADTLFGESGDDIYVVDNVGDTVTENAAEGADLVQSSIAYTLGSNVEHLTLTGSAAINGTGNDLDNVLTGNSGVNTLSGGAGNDTLSGGAGADTLIGGAGDDIYVIDNAGDVVTEAAAEGTDLVQSSVSYTLAGNVENLTLTGSGAVNATGNALDNTLTGNSGVNTLTGGQGNDTYIVNNTTDVVVENASEGTDIVQSSVSYTISANVEELILTGAAAINGTGNASNNVITGNSAANTLNGGAGADTLMGGDGNDIYVVDDVGDAIVEDTSAGSDTVQAGVSHALADNVENLTLTGTSAIDGTGNSLDNMLQGNSGNNTLTGMDGNDTLNGGAGTDTLVGGAGNDTYVVAQATDVVVESDGEGTDLVQSSVTYSLSNFVENLMLTGAGNTAATGNALDNFLTGNDGNNTLNGAAGNDVLDGGAGADTLIGGTGDDVYYLDASDQVTENASEGLDSVFSSSTQTLAANVELLFLTGSAQVNGTGNSASNLLRGNDVRNVLVGSGGIDILEGGAGNDSLSASGGANTLLNGGSGVDTLTGSGSHDLLIGGAGNDTISTGNGRDIIAFNLGDGVDTINASTTQDNTLSLGGGVSYADLLFERSGNNLVMRVGATDQITFTNYYASASNRSIDTLQIMLGGSPDYDPNSSDSMYNRAVQSFDFDGLVDAFDTAQAADPNLTSWALTTALLAEHLGSSDTEALGGDLAYQYGRFGNLSDISFVPALAILGSGTFGQGAQALQNSAALHDSSVRLV